MKSGRFLEKFISRFRLFSCIYWGCVILILCFVVGYQLESRSLTPSDTTYSFASGHTGDYYGYIQMIRRGTEGHILYHDSFTEIPTNDGLDQPFFHLLGLASRPFSLSPFITFFLARVGSMILLFYAVFLLINDVILEERTKVAAGVFALTATSFWQLVYVHGVATIVWPTTWSDFFDLFDKYLRIPPHHFLAFACLIGIIILVGKKQVTQRALVFLGALTIILGLLQPYISLVLVCILGWHIVTLLMEEKHWTHKSSLSASVVILSVIMLGVNFYVLRFVFHAPFATVGIVSFSPRNVSVWTYLLALGPLAFIALGFLFSSSYRTNTKIRLIAWWAIIPIIFFLLPNVTNVFDTNRILQTYQQIPVAILAAIALRIIVKRLPRATYIMGAVVIAVAVYGIFPAYVMRQQALASAQTNYLNIYIPSYLTRIFSYLKRNTKEDSVVLASQTVSNMIPAFTDNKVIIGHDSNEINFTQKLDESNDFFFGRMPEAAVADYLRRMRASYIVFGVEVPPFHDIPYSSLPFLRVVYTDGSISIVRVDLP